MLTIEQTADKLAAQYLERQRKMKEHNWDEESLCTALTNESIYTAALIFGVEYEEVEGLFYGAIDETESGERHA